MHAVLFLSNRLLEESEQSTTKNCVCFSSGINLTKVKRYWKKYRIDPFYLRNSPLFPCGYMTEVTLNIFKNGSQNTNIFILFFYFIFISIFVVLCDCQERVFLLFLFFSLIFFPTIRFRLWKRKTQCCCNHKNLDPPYKTSGYTFFLIIFCILIITVGIQSVGSYFNEYVGL